MPWSWRLQVSPDATPNTPGYCCASWRRDPETLAPVERALSLFELSQLERELGLVSDNVRLQAVAGRSVDQDRLTAANRRLQAELDDNAKAPSPA